IERIVHFRATPTYVRAAAQLYIKRSDHQSGMQAWAKLQVAFQAHPQDLETLGLLAQAFEVIEQPEKALAVHVEMARLARDQNRKVLWAQIMAHLGSVAPNNPEVMALQKAGPPREASAASTAPSTSRAQMREPEQPPAADIPELDVEPEPESQPRPFPSQLPTRAGKYRGTGPIEPVDLDADLEYLDDEAPASVVPFHDDGVEIRDVARMEVVESNSPMAPEAFQASAHAHKAIVDAESFRRLGLL